MQASPEAAVLARQALLDIHYRGKLSLQFLLQVQLASREIRLGLRTFFSGKDDDSHNPTPLNVTASVTEACVNPIVVFNKMCALGMTREIQQLEFLRSHIEYGMGEFIAAWSGHLPTVEFLLAHGSQPRQAFIGAARGGHVSILQWLLKHALLRQADLSEALSNAVKYRRTEAVKLLLATGALRTPIELWKAIQNGYLEEVKSLMAAGRVPTYAELWEAVENNDLETTKVILQHLYGFLQIPAEIDNPLRLALSVLPKGPGAGRRQLDILGAAARRADLESFTLGLQQWPVGEENFRLIDADIGAGGSIDIWRLTGRSVGSRETLVSAARAGHSEMVQFLIPISSAAWYLDALQAAAIEGRLDVARLLVMATSVEERTSFGIALVEACKRGHLEVVQLLVAFVAPQLGLESASEYGHLEVVRLLLKAGATPTHRALQSAQEFYPEVVSLLESYQL